MKRPEVITAALLEELNACHSQLARFKRVFPRGCRISAKSILRALDFELDPHWLCEKLSKKNVFKRAAYRKYVSEVMEISSKYAEEEEIIAFACRGRSPRRSGSVFDWAIFRELISPLRKRAKQKEARIALDLLLEGWKGEE